MPARRQALSFIRSKDVVSKLFSDVALAVQRPTRRLYENRSTRRRIGDAAEMVAIELVARSADTDRGKVAKGTSAPASGDQSSKSKEVSTT